MAYISSEKLSVGYEGRAVLSDISFKVEPGDYLCVVGENGAGKSTFMKTMLGLLPPVQGEVLLGDGLKKYEIGYLPQQTVVQRDFPASVEEIVLSGFQGRMGLRPFYTREEKRVAVENMERLHILGLKDRCYRELSGGQQQRVLLVRALCATGKLLLLDEPVAGLDPKVSEEMYELIKEINAQGASIIMISHDMDAALRYASHILHAGSSCFFGSKEEYLESESGKKFLGRKE